MVKENPEDSGRIGRKVKTSWWKDLKILGPITEKGAIVENTKDKLKAVMTIKTLWRSS